MDYDAFYHSEKLQSTKTPNSIAVSRSSFIIAKNYRVLKLSQISNNTVLSFIIAKNYRVLKRYFEE